MTPGKGFGYHMYWGGKFEDDGGNPTSYDPGTYIEPDPAGPIDDPVTPTSAGSCDDFGYTGAGRFKYKAGPPNRKSMQQDTSGDTRIESAACMAGNVHQVMLLHDTQELTKVTTAGMLWGGSGHWVGAGATNKIHMAHPLIASTSYDLTADAGSFDTWNFVALSEGCGVTPHGQGKGWFYALRVGPNPEDVWGRMTTTATVNNNITPGIGWPSVANDLEYPMHNLQAWAAATGSDNDTAAHSMSLIPDGMLNIRKIQNLQNRFWYSRYETDAWPLSVEPYVYAKWSSDSYDLSTYGDVYMHFDALHGLQEGAGMDPITYSVGLIDHASATTKGHLNGIGNNLNMSGRDTETTLNGYPIMVINGNDTWNQYLLDPASSPSWNTFIGTGPFTMMCLAMIPAAFAGNDCIFTTSGDGTGYWGINNDRLTWDAGSSTYTETGTQTDGVWQLCAIRRDSSDNITMYRQGSDVTSGTPTNSEDWTPYRFFRTNNGLGYAWENTMPTNQPKIAMMAVWYSDLGLSNLNSAANLISTRYNLGQTWSLS